MGWKDGREGGIGRCRCRVFGRKELLGGQVGASWFWWRVGCSGCFVLLGGGSGKSPLPEAVKELGSSSTVSGGESALASLLAKAKDLRHKDGEKSNSEEKYFVAEGIRPVPMKLVKKIQSWMFVELDELLQGQSMKEELLHVQDGVLLFQSVDNARKKRSKIVEFVDWVEAFGVYVAVLSGKFPEVVPFMMAYMVQIKEAYKTWGGNAWQNYDKEFRERAEAKKLRQWDSRDPNLWAKHFSGFPMSSKWHSLSQGESASPPSLRTGKRPLPAPLFPENKEKGPCYPFTNKGVCDRAPPCPFPHICLNCGDNHPARVCPLPQRKSSRAS